MAVAVGGSLIGFWFSAVAASDQSGPPGVTTPPDWTGIWMGTVLFGAAAILAGVWVASPAWRHRLRYRWAQHRVRRRFHRLISVLREDAPGGEEGS